MAVLELVALLLVIMLLLILVQVDLLAQLLLDLVNQAVQDKLLYVTNIKTNLHTF
jgi:hypothetical protein